jgi:hypothetical protein
MRGSQSGPLFTPLNSPNPVCGHAQKRQHQGKERALLIDLGIRLMEGTLSLTTEREGLLRL